MASQAIGDLLAGAAGHPVDRPALEAFVANSQATNGLRTAQTEDALLNAQKLREENDASDQLVNSYMSLKKPDGTPMYQPSEAQWLANQQKFVHGGAQPALEAHMQMKKNGAFDTIADPNADPNARLAAMQAVKGEPLSAFTQDQGQLIGNVGPNAATNPPVIQTPGSQATQNMQNSLGTLRNTQAAAGGFNPHTGGFGLPAGSPESAALGQAISEGRLDPMKVNSRNAQILAGVEMRNPGQTNFNSLHATANLQSNATFQQRAITMEALPTVLSNMTTLGKKVGYNDNATVGKLQQWMNGEFNDPDYTEYMSVRNDALMNIANVMRGVGMSDQAHRAEIEAAQPTMSPMALDAWLKGQMASIKPRLDAQRKVTHLGDPGYQPNKPGDNAPIPPAADAAPHPLDNAPGGPGGTTPPAPEAPPIQLLKEGHVTHFANGQSWALVNGKPQLVPAAGGQ